MYNGFGIGTYSFVVL